MKHFEIIYTKEISMQVVAPDEATTEAMRDAAQLFIRDGGVDHVDWKIKVYENSASPKHRPKPQLRLVGREWFDIEDESTPG